MWIVGKRKKKQLFILPFEQSHLIEETFANLNMPARRYRRSKQGAIKHTPSKIAPPKILMDSNETFVSKPPLPSDDYPTLKQHLLKVYFTLLLYVSLFGVGYFGQNSLDILSVTKWACIPLSLAFLTPELLNTKALLLSCWTCMSLGSIIARDIIPTLSQSEI